MSASLVVEILLGLITAGVALAAYLAATRANRAQAQAAIIAVDAAAYERAKSIYEGAIEALKGQTTDLHEQVVELQNEVSLLREQSANLTAEVTRLRGANTDLREQISILKRKPRGNQ